MPDRIIRDELLESERWLSLKDNTDRLVFLAMLLVADDFGNLEASNWSVRRLGLSFGITTEEHAAQVIANLVDVGLIALYEHQHENDRRGPKRYAHILRFRQRLRFPKKAHPLPEWQLATYEPDVTESAWRDKIRPAILNRDGNECALCQAKDWLHVDHIVPLAKNGKSTAENLITLCRRCNTQKSTSTELSVHLQSLAKERELKIEPPPIDPQLTLGCPPTAKRSEEKRSIYAQSFAQFWQAYPKKKSKGQAERAWSKLRPDAPLIAAILRAIETARSSLAWRRDAGQYIPYPATWLNARGWEDEMTPQNHERRVAL